MKDLSAGEFFMGLLVLLILVFGALQWREANEGAEAVSVPIVPKPKCERECQRGCEPPEVCASLTKEKFQ